MRPFAVAQAAGVPQVRVFVGVDAALDMWRHDPRKGLAAVDRMAADAETHNVHLVLSNYPDLPMISALAGHGYPSWGAAQQDLITPGSVPYERFGHWLADVVPRVAPHPAVAAWEVVNEPGYMLGIDAGTVNVDAGLAFVGHFADLMHSLGARTVAGGGRPVFDPARLSDAQLATYAAHIDVLDDHLYPETAVVGDHGVSGRRRPSRRRLHGDLVRPSPATDRPTCHARDAGEGRQPTIGVVRHRAGGGGPERVAGVGVGVRRLRRERLHRPRTAGCSSVARRSVARRRTGERAVSGSRRHTQVSGASTTVRQP